MSGKSELLTLKKGLHALRFLNQRGPVNLAAVARYLNVPRTNAHRILQTFVGEGYVERVPNSKLYRLTPSVAYLSDGCDTEECLTTVAQPLIAALSEDVHWPLAMVTPQGPHMLVRISTDHQSPLALSRQRPGYASPILLTTTGVLYLALSPPTLRDTLLKVIQANNQYAPYISSAGELDMMMRTAREKLYLIRDHQYPESCLGVPLMSGDHFIGGLVLRYIKAAISREQVIAELLPPLQATAAKIVAGYEASPRVNGERAQDPSLRDDPPPVRTSRRMRMPVTEERLPV